MEIEVILDAAEVESAALRDLARRFLEAEARHLGVPLDVDSVIARRAEGEPEVHITAAADELVKQLAAQPDVLADGSALMVLARAGAMAVVPESARDLSTLTTWHVANRSDGATSSASISYTVRLSPSFAS